MNAATYHSVERVKEYWNMKNQRTAIKNIDLAISRGKRAEDYTSWEYAYLSRKEFGNCTAIAYNNFCYIVNSRGECFTAYPLPAWFGQKKHFAGKERIRNFKKYWKFNDQQFEQSAYA